MVHDHDLLDPCPIDFHYPPPRIFRSDLSASEIVTRSNYAPQRRPLPPALAIVR